MIFFRLEIKMKTFSDEGKSREIVARIPVQQEILKEVLQGKGK